MVVNASQGKKVCWRIVRRCNLNCGFCLSGKNDTYSQELSTNDCMRVVSALRSGGVTRVVLTGGEPFLRTDLGLVLSALHRSGIRVDLTTNGQWLLEADLAWMRTVIDFLRVSVDGPKDVHDSIRGVGRFNKAQQGIQRATRLGMKCVVNSVVCRRTVESIPRMIEEFIDYGVRRFVLLELMIRERATLGQFKFPSDKQLRDFEARCCEIVRRNAGVTLSYNNYSNNRDRYVVVENDGTVVLCRGASVDVSYGNVLSNNKGIIRALARQELCHRQRIELKGARSIQRAAPV